MTSCIILFFICYAFFLSGRNTFGTCFGETGLKIRPDVFRHDNCEQKKHFLLCKMSPASHFFLFEKGEKKYMKSVHSCREETLWQTFCPTSRSRCIFKNSDSCRHKVCDRMRLHAIACDPMRSHRMRSLRHRSQKIECLFTGGYDIRLSYPQIATRKSPLGLGYLRTHPCLQVENTNRSCLVWYLSYLFIYFS